MRWKLQFYCNTDRLDNCQILARSKKQFRLSESEILRCENNCVAKRFSVACNELIRIFLSGKRKG